MIDRYHEKAAAEGTRLIPFCGFDSVPSDLGAMLIADALGPQTATVIAFFQMAGGLNGGTLASALNMAETGADKLMRDPFLLSPQIQRPLQELERDPTVATFDERLTSLDGPVRDGPRQHPSGPPKLPDPRG